MKLFGYKIRIELILTIFFFIVPIILPLLSGVIQPSLSEYHYTSQRNTYIILLGIIGLLITLDGSIYKSRRYNLLIGLSMIGVVLFPVNQFRIIHDVLAIIFFVGNAYIVTWYSVLLPRKVKVQFRIIIILSLLLLITGVFSLF